MTEESENFLSKAIYASIGKIPSELVDHTLRAAKTLAEKRSTVNAEAERLNACILRFEAWVAEIPGRVETVVEIPDFDPHSNPSGALAFLIRVSREGKSWIVTWGYQERDDPDSTVNWKPAREASIELKLHVIPRLPQLIVAMANHQDNLRLRINAVANGFDEFAGKVGIPKGGK